MYEYREGRGDSRHIKTRNNPILKSKIIVFIELKVVK